LQRTVNGLVREVIVIDTATCGRIDPAKALVKQMLASFKGAAKTLASKVMPV